MTKPPTMLQAEERGLVGKPFTVHARAQGIHTFSNGSEWDGWASGNCFECWYYDVECAGALCAFEAASFLHMVTPDLARLFGWTQRTEEYGPASGWEPPQTCPFFRARADDDGDDNPPPPPPDPAQLVLIADPTEDAALITDAPVLVEVETP